VFMLTMTIGGPLVLCQMQPPMAGETADACGGPGPGPRRASVRRRVEIWGLTAGSGNPSTQRLFPRTRIGVACGSRYPSCRVACGVAVGVCRVCRLLPVSRLTALTNSLLIVSSQQAEIGRHPSPPQCEHGRG
jgi:hypothetical protein